MSDLAIVNGKVRPSSWEQDREEDLYPYPRTAGAISEEIRRHGVLVSSVEFFRWQWLEGVAVELMQERDTLRAEVERLTALVGSMTAAIQWCACGDAIPPSSGGQCGTCALVEGMAADRSDE